MTVNNSAKENCRIFDILKWILVSVLLVIAIIGNYYFRQCNLALRVIAVIAIAAGAGGIALLTARGQATLAFARESRIEMSKVIWPTRQETLYTTLMVAVVTAVMALFLWGLDSILVRLVSFITSLRF